MLRTIGVRLKPGYAATSRRVLLMSPEHWSLVKAILSDFLDLARVTLIQK